MSLTQADKSPHSYVVVDTMGGDLGPSVQVEGALEAWKEYGARSILVGPREELISLLEGFGGVSSPLIVQNATEVIDMSDSPARAVKKKPDSSLNVAYRLLLEGRGHSVLSSGNSGAMMAAGRMISGLLPGIERPAIATLIPNGDGPHPNVVMDSGANVDCHARHLVHFALMGSIYYSALFGVESPRVGLLSNGTEASKGTDVIRSAALMLNQLKTLHYVGYVEGRDVARDNADVIVCDGFVGNVLLKTMEGCVSLIYKEIKSEANNSLMTKFGLMLAKRGLRSVFKEKLDYSAHGGAPLLGLRHLALVLHGSSNKKAVKNAIRLSSSYVEQGMLVKLASAISQIEEQFLDLDQNFSSGMYSSGPSPMNGESSTTNDAKDFSGKIRRINVEDINQD